MQILTIINIEFSQTKYTDSSDPDLVRYLSRTKCTNTKMLPVYKVDFHQSSAR